MKNIFLLVTALAAFPGSAVAEVKNSSDNGFVIIHNAEVDATAEDIWKRLLAPKDWWQASHSWSGSSDGFYIDPQAGGCFCELFQEKQKDGKLKTSGSVEHMRVIFAQPGKVLRMQGALGPLQSEAVIGTFTVAIAPNKTGKGNKLSFSYVVGGYMRYKASEIAPAVDKVLSEQFSSLIKPFQKTSAVEDKPSNWSLDIDGLSDKSDDVPEPASDSEALELPKSDETTAEVKPIAAPRVRPKAGTNPTVKAPAKKAPASKTTAPKTTAPKTKAPVADPATTAKKER